MRLFVTWEVDEGEKYPPQIVEVPLEVCRGLDNEKICNFLSDNWGFLVQDWVVFEI